jgi:hypothetical protein
MLVACRLAGLSALEAARRLKPFQQRSARISQLRKFAHLSGLAWPRRGKIERKDTKLGLRFFRRVRVLPGLTLNFSKGGMSVSAGVKGAHVTLSKDGVRETVGLPGSGVYWTERQGWRSKAPYLGTTPPAPRSTAGVVLWLIALIALALWLASIGIYQAKGAEVCDLQHQCYHYGAPAGPKVDPRRFDTRSTSRTDCNASGCSPLSAPGENSPTVRNETVGQEPPGAAPEALAPEGYEYAYRPPEAAQDASLARRCAFARQAIYVSLRQLFAMHRICDWR